MTKENPHKIKLWTELTGGDDRHTLECDAEGCGWKIPTNEALQAGARRAAQEHIDMWNLRQANAGHVGLIGVVTAERDGARKAYEAVMTELSEGRLSDGYHTHKELYAHRMLLTAHAVLGWAAAGYTVVKSWKHSDGEPCFGGGWFIVVAILPSVGQVSYHYQAQHWDLFDIDEVETPPTFDGHTPDDVLARLKASLHVFSDDTVSLIASAEELGALHAMGVDNWEGYEIAMEELENN